MTLPARMTAIAITRPRRARDAGARRSGRCRLPGAGEILVKVAAAGVNRPDVRAAPGHSIRRPRARPTFRASRSPARWWRSAPASSAGSSATRSARSWSAAAMRNIAWRYETHALPVPPRLSMVEAAAIPETFFTCWQNMFDARRVQGGDWRCWCMAAPRASAPPRSARQGVRRQGHRDRRLGREMRGGQEARRRRRGELQDRGFRRRDQGRRPAARAPT